MPRSVHWAHQKTADHPDGQLYVDLCGYAGEGRQLSTATALERVLRDLGVAGETATVPCVRR
jgi:hypothetical protein